MGAACSQTDDKPKGEKQPVVTPQSTPAQTTTQKTTPAATTPAVDDGSVRPLPQQSKANQPITRHVIKPRATVVTGDDGEDAFKLIVCGAGESGKTTFTRHLRMSYIGTVDKKERMMQVPIIRGNMIEAVQKLIIFIRDQGLSLPQEYEDFADNITDCDPFDSDFDEFVDQMKQVWKLPEIQKAYTNPDQTLVPDNMDYFFNKIDEIKKSDYVPTDKDILRVRVRTVGVKPLVFDLLGARFKISDVGGQLCERKNWDSILEEVEGIIFIVSLSEYDRKMFENPDERRIDDALQLFAQTVNSPLTRDLAVYLVCNKIDQFERKIRETDTFSAAFPDFHGNPHDPEETSAFLIKKFTDKIVDEDGSRDVKTYKMSAIDQESIVNTVESVFTHINNEYFQD